MAQMTLRALSVEQGWAGVPSIESLTKKSGLLMAGGAIPASHLIKHKHKRLDVLPTFSWRDAGGSQSLVTTNSNLHETNLKIIGTLESEPADFLVDWPGGPEAYFTQEKPAYEEAFGQAASVGLFYGTDSTHGNAKAPVGIHQYGVAAGKTIQNAQAGDTGSTSSIFAIKFRPGNNGCGILFDPNVTAAGNLMSSEVLNGGLKRTITVSTTGPTSQVVYQVEHTGKLAFLTTATKDIGIYNRIQDATSERPTSAKMDELIDSVEFDTDGSTILFMNAATRRMLNVLSDSKLSTDTITTDFHKFQSSWNGVPIMIDNNLLSTEANTLW